MSENRTAPTDAEIRQKQARVIAVFSKRPDAARSTNSASAVVGEGLRCDFSQGNGTAVMDMPAIMGGGDAGPTPGFFARAGICGCVSIGIKQAAINAGMTLRRVAVDIETDFDDAAMYGIGGNSAAPLETRLTIAIDTDAPEAEVAALVDRALSMDPWYLALRDAQSVKTAVTVGA